MVYLEPGSVIFTEWNVDKWETCSMISSYSWCNIFSWLSLLDKCVFETRSQRSNLSKVMQLAKKEVKIFSQEVDQCLVQQTDEITISEVQ